MRATEGRKERYLSYIVRAGPVQPFNSRSHVLLLHLLDTVEDLSRCERGWMHEGACGLALFVQPLRCFSLKEIKGTVPWVSFVVTDANGAMGLSLY